MTVFPESPFDWNFFKVGSIIVYSFIKKTSPTYKACPCPSHIWEPWPSSVQKYDPMFIFSRFKKSTQMHRKFKVKAQIRVHQNPIRNVLTDLWLLSWWSWRFRTIVDPKHCRPQGNHDSKVLHQPPISFSILCVLSWYFQGFVSKEILLHI